MLALCAGALAGVRPAAAQTKPPIRIVVPTPAGGAADDVAQVVATALHDISGESVGVVNVPGNAGVDGTTAIAAGAPDGRLLGLAVSTAMVAGKLLSRNVHYDPLRDFDWLAIIGSYPNAMVIDAATPAASLAEWIALAKRAPSPVRVGTFGRGSAGHIATGFLRKIEGIDIEHVTIPVLANGYRRLADRTLDVLFDGVPNAISEVPASPVRIVAVTSAERVPALPTVTCFGEQWKGQRFEVWVGVVAPKGLPVAAYSELSALFGVMCNDPKYRDRFVQAGVHFVGVTGKAAREYIETDFIRTARLIAEFGLDGDR